MKFVLGGLAIVSVVSGFYFFFSAMVAWGEAQAAMKQVSYRAPSLLPPMLDFGSFTDRSKEWFASFFQRCFFMFVSLVVGITSIGGLEHLEHLQDGGNGPGSLLLLVVPATLGSMGFIGFVASVVWLLIGLGNAAIRWLRNQPTSDVQRRRIGKSLLWTVGFLVIAVLPGVAAHFIRRG